MERGEIDSERRVRNREERENKGIKKGHQMPGHDVTAS